MKRLGLLLLCVIGLSGCVNESADLGAAPPVLLSSPARVILVPPQALRTVTGRARLRQELYAVAGRDIQGLRARIRPRTIGEAEPIRRMLVGLGMEPARIAMDLQAPGERHPTELLLSRTLAETAPCADAIHPAYPDDPLPSLMSLARCTQTNNLAAMVADPADLVAPPALDHEDGVYLTGGVHDWHANRGLALPAPGTSSPSSGASSSAGSPSTAAATPVAVVPSVNTVQPGQATVTQ